MATPAHRTSKTKKRMRRGHIKLNVPNVRLDPARANTPYPTTFHQVGNTRGVP